MSRTPRTDGRPGATALEPDDIGAQADRRHSAGVIDSREPVWNSRRGEVAMVAGAGRLADIVTDLRKAMLLALAEDPRAVVCDMSAVRDASKADARALLTTTGLHVRNWPAVPVAMLCPDPALRERLRKAPMSEYVLLRATLGESLAAVARAAPPMTARLHLVPHATASRLARDFVSRTCLDWGLAHGIAAACLVVSEFVTSGLGQAITDMDLTVARHSGVLRLAVRDRGAKPSLESTRHRASVTGRGLALVDACSRAWGVLPTGDGGKVVWAVLDV